jgi:hypothetical protein
VGYLASEYVIVGFGVNDIEPRISAAVIITQKIGFNQTWL